MIINTVQDVIDALSGLPASTRGAQLRVSDGVHCDSPVLGVSYDLGIVSITIEPPDCGYRMHGGDDDVVDEGPRL